MKKAWTKLVSLYKIKDKRQMNIAFMKHHKNACEIATDKEGTVMAAVYFTPTALDKMNTKAFFREVQSRTLYAYEQDQADERK